MLKLEILPLSRFGQYSGDMSYECSTAHIWIRGVSPNFEILSHILGLTTQLILVGLMRAVGAIIYQVSNFTEWADLGERHLKIHI